MKKNLDALLSIKPLCLDGLYSAKILFQGIEYNFDVTVDDKDIPVAFGDKRLFAVLGEDIDCYTNVLKAVRLRHLHQDISLPASLSTLESIS